MRNDPERAPLAKGWACAWIVFHLNGLTQVNFWEAKVQHQMAWVIAWSLLFAGMPKESDDKEELAPHG